MEDNIYEGAALEALSEDAKRVDADYIAEDDGGGSEDDGSESGGSSDGGWSPPEQSDEELEQIYRDMDAELPDDLSERLDKKRSEAAGKVDNADGGGGEGRRRNNEKNRERRLNREAKIATEAAERAAAETEKRITQRLEEQSRVREDERVKALNMTDPETGKQITTAAEYDIFIKAQKERELSERLASGEFSADDVKEITRAELDERERRNRADEEFRKALEEDVREIGRRFDKTVVTVEDLREKPIFTKLVAAVREGRAKSLSDAYAKITEADRAEQAEIDRRVRAALDKKAGKGHLMGTPLGKTGGASYTREEVEAYKYLDPSLTESEIIERLTGK